MALFTDAEIVTLDDLLVFEKSLVDVSSSHGINVETKINLSISAIGDRLLLWLLRAGYADPQFLTRRVLGLSTVVVTPTLDRWVCFDSLSRFFAEAYNVQLNTRFEGKWTEYKAEAEAAARMVALSGIGIVNGALPKPGMPVYSIINGGSPLQALYIQTAWTDALGNEGALSPVNAITLDPGSGIILEMAEGAIGPKAAVGWNVYLSADGAYTTKQNDAPVFIGSTWTLPDSGLVGGPLPIDGQVPNFYIIDPQRILRG